MFPYFDLVTQAHTSQTVTIGVKGQLFFEKFYILR
jgi:hypothetical protein